MSKFKRSAAKTINLKDAKFVYVSICCNAVAEKPALLMPRGKGVGTYLGAKPETETQGLGGWRCSTCRKPCKVQRTKKEQNENLHQVQNSQSGEGVQQENTRD
jgi:hypothetical protein